MSDWIELKQSLPRGTVLGPLLFNLYVCGLSNQIIQKALIIKNADDCLLYGSYSESEIALNRLREKLIKLKNYFSFNRLNLNESKTKFLTFCHKMINVCRTQKQL